MIFYSLIGAGFETTEKIEFSSKERRELRYFPQVGKLPVAVVVGDDFVRAVSGKRRGPPRLKHR